MAGDTCSLIHLGHVPQIKCWSGFDPLTGHCSEWQHYKNGVCREHHSMNFVHTVNNVMCLDLELGIQASKSLMEEVKKDVVYRIVMAEVGKRTKAGLRNLPCDH